MPHAIGYLAVLQHAGQYAVPEGVDDHRYDEDQLMVGMISD